MSKISAVLTLNVLVAFIILVCDGVIRPFPRPFPAKGKRRFQVDGRLALVTQNERNCDRILRRGKLPKTFQMYE